MHHLHTYFYTQQGVAVLAQHPELTATSGGRGSRGIRIESPSSSYSMQLGVVHALSRSLGSTTITLNRKIIEDLRKEAVDKHLPLALLTTANLVSSLLDEIGNMNIKYICHVMYI
jgi:hypothetical protein